MKKSFPYRPSRSGFALIIVLGVLVLMVILLVGFLSQVATERTSSSAYRASAGARSLADNVASLVEGQIGMASTQGSTVSWASQPGLVRTFGSAGSLKQAFKLYSAPSMILGTDTSPLSLANLNTGLSADIPPSTWAQNAALWTDLNSPVTGANGLANFPILDTGTATGESQVVAPAGFSITNPPGATASQPAPMPVQWLYMLKDGTLVSPTAGTNVGSVNVSGDSTANLIIGRIAFWTDDDTCKVNINTASEGTYWDVPRGATQTDYNLGNCQPVQYEYQRYPGHPAMTSLSAVLQSPSGQPLLTSEQTYGVVPRIVGGGSTEGTVPTNIAQTITPDVDRLYASVNELIFSTTRGSNAGLTRSELEQSKFFLTARSRAPELNLFNLPRIACWPVYALNNSGGYDTSHTTAFDRVIADCSTVNGQPYFFQRQLSGSPTNDIQIGRNQQLYAYLQYLTSQNVPGYGAGTFLGKYGADRDQILTEIFDYIRSTNLYDDLLASGNQFTVGFSNPSTGSPSVTHGWVVPTQYTPPKGASTLGFGRAVTLAQIGIGFICNADGADTTLGSNNYLQNTALGGSSLAAANGTTPAQKCIQAIIVPEFYTPMYGWTGVGPYFQMEISGLAAFQVNSASLGFPSDATSIYSLDPSWPSGGRDWGGNLGWRYFGLEKFLPAKVPMPADSSGSKAPFPYYFVGNPIRITPTSSGFMNFTGGTITVTLSTGPLASPPNVVMQTLSINFPSGTFPVPNLVTTGTPAYTPASVVSTSPQNWWAYSVTGCVTGFSGRLANIGLSETLDGSTVEPINSLIYMPGPGAFFRNDANFDVLRTLGPPHGDYRLIAGMSNVPATVFQPHPLYGQTSVFMASNLSTGCGSTASTQGYDTNGKYISSISYGLGVNPDIPENATQTPEATGDYDSALPRGLDGPYINKPDEGNLLRAGGAPMNVPYFGLANVQISPGPTFFSPNRMMPSPGMFGSLPTGVKAGVPWQTLLFRPQLGHPGSAIPEDELMLDLFWMPVVEPYAISDRFSTAGKINMNYQIVPFGTYLTRATGIEALLKSEKIGAISNADVSNYRSFSIVNTMPDFRLNIDAAATLTQFTNKFTNSGASKFWDIFKSPSEICDLHICPQGQTPATMPTFWQQNALTGDNIRERIYTTLYPRLTTQSNTFTIYFRVQGLKKSPQSTQGVWTEGSDIITSEYRGSTTIERYIDSNNAAIPNYAADAAGGTLGSDPTLDTFYKWRVISNRQFAP